MSEFVERAGNLKKNIKGRRSVGRSGEKGRDLTDFPAPAGRGMGIALWDGIWYDGNTGSKTVPDGAAPRGRSMILGGSV